jgi:hypothetical protein
MPKCSSDEDLMSLHNPLNNPTSGAFTILPKNGSLFLTLTEDSLVYADFCVDRGFRRNTLVSSSKAVLAGFGKLAQHGSSKSNFEFAGTVVVFCQPGKKQLFNLT